MPPTTPSSPLGAIIQRLAGAPQAQLPHLVSSLTNDLTHCRMVLSASASHHTHHGPESAVLVHKYKTQISTLLQDKRVEARWAAVVLVKATIQVGGWEVLQGAAVWVRALLGILGVNMDPSSITRRAPPTRLNVRKPGTFTCTINYILKANSCPPFCRSQTL